MSSCFVPLPSFLIDLEPGKKSIEGIQKMNSYLVNQKNEPFRAALRYFKITNQRLILSHESRLVDIDGRT
jgi:hypothetical protein